MSANDSSPNPEKSNSLTEEVSQVLQDGSLAALVTLIQAEAKASLVGTKLLVGTSEAPEKAVGTLGDEALDQAVTTRAAAFLQSNAETLVVQVKEFAPSLEDWSEALILLERIQQEPRLVICGSGHVGASLARLSALMGYRATLIDDRAEFVRRELFTDELIDLVATNNWPAAVRTAVGDGRGVYVAVVTRGHSEDEQCMSAIVGAGAAYVGLIGSRRRTKIVLQRLRENGANERELAAVHAPIGLDIGAVTPEEVALAIMAEIVTVRRGGSGSPLSEVRRERNRQGAKTAK
ncbi:MAG TPA: XdhC family protein [Pyrinomonadaceae bacterium]|nr:XdhC family protein [Pyrinomonadaceae bacterium]